MREAGTEITLARHSDLDRLFEIWESSVRATHSFLAEEHIQTFIPLVKEELARFSPIFCLRDTEGQAIAFMGVANGKIEMLFVAPENIGQGAGRRLVEYAIVNLDARRVDVNEQNPQATGFYQHMGYGISCRGPVGTRPVWQSFSAAPYGVRYRPQSQLA